MNTRRSSEADALAAAIKATPKAGLNKYRLRYICPNKKRCTVLDAYQVPGKGVLLMLPAYKIERSRNEDLSNAAGRAANTTDGERHWKGWNAFLDESNNYDLRCDHLATSIASDQILDDLKTRRREIVVNP